MEQVGDGTALHDPPGVHDGGGVAQLRDDRQVVGDQQQPQTQLLGESLEQGEDLRLHHGVQRGGGLVGDEQPRIAGQRHRHHRPLPHPAGELVGVAAPTMKSR